MAKVVSSSTRTAKGGDCRVEHKMSKASHDHRAPASVRFVRYTHLVWRDARLQVQQTQYQTPRKVTGSDSARSIGQRERWGWTRDERLATNRLHGKLYKRRLRRPMMSSAGFSSWNKTDVFGSKMATLEHKKSVLEAHKIDRACWILGG